MKASHTILLAGIFGVSAVHAQKTDSTVVLEENLIEVSSSNTSEESLPELEIGALIIDNTFSKAGNDFQQLFNTRWNWPTQQADQFIITVTERPSFVNSTIVEISVNELKVFEGFLQPRYDVLEQVVDQAIGISTQYILNYEDVVKELSGEDLSGSGIY